MTTNATKPLVALRDFNDAGTERRFEKGLPVDVDAGTLANYVAAGLVGEQPDQEPATDAEAA